MKINEFMKKRKILIVVVCVVLIAALLGLHTAIAAIMITHTDLFTIMPQSCRCMYTVRHWIIMQAAVMYSAAAVILSPLQSGFSPVSLLILFISEFRILLHSIL